MTGAYESYGLDLRATEGDEAYAAWRAAAYPTRSRRKAARRLRRVAGITALVVLVVALAVVALAMMIALAVAL